MDTHYSKLPSAVDMAGYAPFYQRVTRAAIARNQDSSFVVVEAGVRHGCSARIFMEALQDSPDWQLHLIDPAPMPEALALCGNTHVTLHQQEAQGVASQFPDASIDVLHLDVDYDGTHPYQLTFEILLAFWHKLKPDASVFCHDCSDYFPGIVRLVNELGSSGWTIERCPPVPECPIAAPAHARRDGELNKTLLGHPVMGGCITELNELPTLNKTGITVVVPVIQDRFLSSLLSNIQANDIKPVDIVIIDNSAGGVQGLCDAFRDLPIRCLKQTRNIGVNASWNLGVAEAKTELIAILNDDLVLPSSFFRSIRDAFACFPRAGFVIPATVGPPFSGGQPPWKIGTPEEITADNDLPRVVSMDDRNGGWAMTIRKSLWTPIPETMFTFCGDDFIFKQIKDAGFWALQTLNNRIYHYVGISFDLKQRARLRLPDIAQDRKAWSRIRATKRT